MRVRHWEVVRLAPQLLNGPNGALHHLRIRTRVAEGHGSSVRCDRMAAADGDVAVCDKRPAFALAAESERLELANDLERERIVEFQHIHVVSPKSGVAEGTLGRASADYAVHVIAAPAYEIPRGWVLIRRAVEVRAAAQHVDRLAVNVHFVQVRHDQRAPAFGSGGAIE